MRIRPIAITATFAIIRLWIAQYVSIIMLEVGPPFLPLFDFGSSAYYRDPVASKNPLVLFVVPYRDRDAHGKIFIERMSKYAEDRAKLDRSNVEYHVVFSEQFDYFQFNRGWLFNVGFAEMSKVMRLDSACVVLQDVDTIPYATVDFADCSPPTHYAVTVDGRNDMYDGFVGMSLGMTGAAWNRINGAANNYFGWGAEDDDIFCRLRQNGMTGRYNVRRPQGEAGHFASLNDRTMRDRVDNHQITGTLNAMERGEPVWKNNGLNSLVYFKAFDLPVQKKSANFFVHWIGSTFTEFPDYTKILVDIRTPKCSSPSGPLGNVPYSYSALLGRFECQPSVVVLLVNMTTGESIIAENWFKLIRWLRTANQAPSGIIITDDQTEIRFSPRTTPICYTNDKIEVGTFWCSGDSISVLTTYHADDIDLISDPEQTIDLCFTLNPLHITKNTRSQCNGESLTFRKGKSLCVENDRIKNNCWNPEVAFDSVELAKPILTTSLCEVAPCSDHNASILASKADWITNSEKVCLQDDGLTRTPCPSQNQLFFAKAGSHADKVWCLENFQPNTKFKVTYGPCINRGTSVRSLAIHDIPINRLVVRRDIPSTKSTMPNLNSR